MSNSAEIRQDIIKALQLDLIGPPPNNTTYTREILPVAPSLWYLTGFLVPFHAPLEMRTDDTANDELDQLSLAIPGDDEATPEKTAARKGFFPSSIGLSFFLPETTKEVEVIVTWGDYFPEETGEETPEEKLPEDTGEEKERTPLQKRTTQPWKRIPKEEILTVPIKKDNLEIPNSGGLWLMVNVAPLRRYDSLPPGTQSVSIFLVNQRKSLSAKERDMSYIFQACLKINSASGLHKEVRSQKSEVRSSVDNSSERSSVDNSSERSSVDNSSEKSSVDNSSERSSVDNSSEQDARTDSPPVRTLLATSLPTPSLPHSPTPHSPTPHSGFTPRSNTRGQKGNDWDERVADLQYRFDYEYAVGHNVAVNAVLEAPGICQTIETAWIPSADVEKVAPQKVSGVNLGMEALGSAGSGAEIREMVGEMVTAYGEWITKQHQNIPSDNEHREEVAEELLSRATVAKDRIADGLAALDNEDVLLAFQTANRAIATAIRQRSTHGNESKPEDLKPPAWRPFQLAFILMNMRGIIEPKHQDRELVDLLFFPTGGGKTEAYLGLAAFTILLRRLKNPGIQGAGVSVIMRYTLRLLTLDQLGRAATLICALELERQKNPEIFGDWPIEIGLWVGQTATPNVMGKKGDNNSYSARARTIAFQNNPKSKPSPIPLESCPWCGEKFSEKAFNLTPNPDNPLSLEIKCSPARNLSKNKDKAARKPPNCAFRRNNKLPILSVDDEIYRRLPSIIIATVDKFANLPWVGQTSALFGKVNRYDNSGFYGYGTLLKGGHNLEKELLPPELIIQDELHLISGPLGTMVGLYETAVEALCTYQKDSEKIKPKIIASTATVRRASKQIKGLFARDKVDIFPPPSIDRRDSFFAKTVSKTEANARQYLGIAAPGRSLKVVLLRTYLALLGAAQKFWEKEGGSRNKENPADPYMTLLGYFNSLRELGGSRRIVEDEVTSRLNKYGQRLRQEEIEGLFNSRKIKNEPSELTSRESTNKVAETKRRLALTFHNKDERVDVALATNMISVGLDITRLGLMVVLGQPKTASEYIQATSRVGRDDERPGLVVTLLNVKRPRDRSHYERFQYWHTIFYRAVEATSVTPFSPRAVDRAIAAVTVALARLDHSELTAALGAGEIIHYRQELEKVVETISQRAENHDDLDSATTAEIKEKIAARVKDILDSWVNIAQEQKKLQYQKEVDLATPLLYDPLDPALKTKSQEAQKFKAQRSLRDVEPSVNLWVTTPTGQEVESEE